MSVMMTYIILFSPDSVQLENKKIIEKIQVKENISGSRFSEIIKRYFPEYVKNFEYY